ncbi:MAG TPA: EamA family transporter, partial [Candidatus Binatia bacterium]|nr:EamA family transporter [Candidatus Binatia bacterium]
AALLVAEPGLFAPGAAVLAAFAYQAVAIAFVSYLVWYWLLAYYPAALLAAFSFWTPLFGVAAGALLLGEPLGPRLVAAALMVAGGIVLVNRPDRLGSPLATPGTAG